MTKENFIKSITRLKCPMCNADLVIRKNSKDYNQFFACSNYSSTKCDFTIGIQNLANLCIEYGKTIAEKEVKTLKEQDHLFKNAEEAFISAIEIYNKPIMTYKFETSLILLINAWELLLKAIMVKINGSPSIRNKKNYTIEFHEVLSKVFSLEENLISLPTKENLLILHEIRNNFIHFYQEKYDTFMYSLTTKTIHEFISLATKFFEFEHQTLLNMQYTPLFFNITKTTIQELQDMSNSKNFYIKSVADRIFNFANANNETDSVLFNIDYTLQSVKNLKNADILLGLDTNSNYTLNQEKKVILASSDEKGIQKVNLTEDEINKLYPYGYRDLSKFAKGKYYKKVIGFLQEIKDNPTFSYNKGKHPSRKSGGYYVYSQAAYDEVQKIINEK